MYTIDDVGDVPGRPPLTDKEKQRIADEWNANAARPLPDVNDISLSLEERIALLEAEVSVPQAKIRAKKQAKRDAGEA